jgi:hypothetical protein
MAFVIVVLAALVLVAVGVYSVRSRREPADDTRRFHHAQEITTSWSRTYDGAQVHEEPEASEGKPELQHTVHLVDA